MKINADLIAVAIKAIEDQGIARNGKVPNEFKGYIDTFSASIVQNGLIPAVIFFESGSKNRDESKNGKTESESKDKEKEKIEENRNKMMQVILSLVKGKKSSEKQEKKPTLLNYVVSWQKNNKDMKKIRQDIVEAAVAFKLALRTFKFEK